MRIGLTGGIASGKSTVSLYLASLGMEIIDGDLLAREVLVLYPEILTYLQDTYGDLIFQEGQLDRRALGRIIFQDEEKKRAYLDVIMPKIVEEARKRLKEAKGSFVVLDAALLFEEGLEKDVDITVTVFVPYEVQLERLLKRDGLTVSEAVSRIRSQMPLAEKKRRADHVVDNSGSREETYQQINEILKSLGFGEIKGQENEKKKKEEE
ncbi:dephospho-CoA kinase [Proteiniclasticum ruminis]|uniref:Dephospho-CoA kinase n=1 Tax=Proteiniclasticum ruminis TaxID=398199 RepID=A0A1G8PDM2_9CLOT|nr:dephospho-CoA kinase [Proteiniclasticum ruminis]SDI90517.1 dephospho-CoA kinase [Proteiniclasticum ruminis]